MVRQLRAWGSVCFVALSLLVWRTVSMAIPLDQAGDIKLGVRTYVNARVGTEGTQDGVPLSSGFGNNKVTASTSATFPHSDAGHLRQNRYFIEIDLKHDLDRLVREGVGPLSLLNDLPFKVKGLSYNVTFRGEGETVYDWGPREYSTTEQTQKAAEVEPVIARHQTVVNVGAARHTLRQLGTDRERLFQAFGQAYFGDLFLRVGRQNLSWGETDAFQLLDHINPIDSSFGGFLISLDERRIPLDMAVANYYLGDFGPFTEGHLEGFAAYDDRVGYAPGTPAGSPWTLPSLGAPSNSTENFLVTPGRTVGNMRGGFQLKFNALDATFGLAHYYTYFDTEGLQVYTNPANNPSSPPLIAYEEGYSCTPSANPAANPNGCGYVAHAYHTAPKVQVSGASTTFALPQLYSVVRSEFAYFKDEAAFTQGQLDPFLYQTPDHTGGRRLRNSINGVVGFDTNQWIRPLNANQTFFISTQFFYKHIQNAAGSRMYNCDAQGKNCAPNPDREVLPIEKTLANYNAGLITLGNVEPVFINQPSYQYLQTLFVGTSYRSGTVNPGVTFFYDWGGAFLYQPSIQFNRDPYRFYVDYSIITAQSYKGGSGVSLLKDRDNVQVRFEYVL